MREALCTLGNGYFATRGASLESQSDGTHYPGTYLAGAYNRLHSEIADRTIENEDLVNLANWHPLNFRVVGERWFDPEEVEIMDLRAGASNRKENTQGSVLSGKASQKRDREDQA